MVWAADPVARPGVGGFLLAIEPGLREGHHMRRGVALHRVSYAVGVLWLAMAAFGEAWFVIVGVAFLVVGALLHLRYRRSVARYAFGTMAPDDRLVSRPGMRDRYEGVVDSLLRW